MFLQEREFLNDRGGNQVGPGAQHLAELDESGAQVFQRSAKAAGARFVMFRHVSLSQEDSAAPAQVTVEPQLLHDVAETVLEKHGGNLPAAAEIAKETEWMRFGQHVSAHQGRKKSRSYGPSGLKQVNPQHTGIGIPHGYITEK